MSTGHFLNAPLFFIDELIALAKNVQGHFLNAPLFFIDELIALAKNVHRTFS
jgi:hypothetical protein